MAHVEARTCLAGQRHSAACGLHASIMVAYHRVAIDWQLLAVAGHQRLAVAAYGGFILGMNRYDGRHLTHDAAYHVATFHEHSPVEEPRKSFTPATRV